MVGAARVICLVAALATVFAQTNSIPPPPKRAPKQDPVLRITVNLVEVDALVTDSRGRQVTNLGAGDFEVLEDGHPQKLPRALTSKSPSLLRTA
jgi:hypothetical protein